MKTGFSMLEDAALYVGTYGKYNNGNLSGKWLRLADYSSLEDFEAACLDLHKDESDPEIMFQDYEGLPGSWYSECEAPAAYWDLMDAISDTDNLDALAAYIDCFYSGSDMDDIQDIVNSFEDAYVCDSREDFEAYADELLECSGPIPSYLAACIDYEAWYHNLLISDYCEHDGFYFRNH